MSTPKMLNGFIAWSGPEAFLAMLDDKKIIWQLSDERPEGFHFRPRENPHEQALIDTAYAHADELLPLMKDRWGPPVTDASPFLHPPDMGAVIADLIRNTADQGNVERPRGRGATTAAARPLTDLGNAERLVDRYIGRIRYVVERGMWATWTGTHWQLDGDGAVERMMKETARSIFNEVLVAQTPAERNEISRHGMKSESAQRISGALRLAETEPGIPAHINEFDTDPMAINCISGLIRLEKTSCRIDKHDPTMLVMKHVPIKYDPTASCPQWLKFLETVLPSEPLRSFVKRAVGYSITASTREQKIFVPYGSGANGKSTFLEVLAMMMNDYAQQADAKTFMARQNDDRIPNDIARMVGARLVTAVETDEGVRLSEALVKQLTGGDRVSARFLHREWFDFHPVAKIWLATNHKPAIRGTNNAIWRRLALIPFNVTIPDEHQDKDLKEKLWKELPGIFAWAIEGCSEWLRDGLGVPEEVQTATGAYRNEMDTLGNWITECCVQLPNVEASAKSLYENYKTWADDNGERVESQKWVGMRLAERGFGKQEKRDGNYWSGIGVRTSKD